MASDGRDWPVWGGRRLQEVLTLWLRPSASGLGSGLRGTDRKWLRLMGWVWLWARHGRLRRDGFRLFSFRISLMLVCMPAALEKSQRQNEGERRQSNIYFKARFIYCFIGNCLRAKKKKKLGSVRCWIFAQRRDAKFGLDKQRTVQRYTRSKLSHPAAQRCLGWLMGSVTVEAQSGGMATLTLWKWNRPAEWDGVQWARITSTARSLLLVADVAP